jgi:hypothetical protein
MVGTSMQEVAHHLHRSDGTILAANTPQLILGRSMARSHLLLQNTSAGPLWFEIGAGGATCTISGGGVNSITVTNAGFGYSHPPLVRFYGGGSAYGNSSYTGLAQPLAPPPNSVGSASNMIEPLGKGAQAVCVMTGSAPNMSIASITILRPGTGYVLAPFVEIMNGDLDPNGAAAPSVGVGILLPSGGEPLIYNGTVCPTDPVAVFGATTGQSFVARWMS